MSGRLGPDCRHASVLQMATGRLVLGLSRTHCPVLLVRVAVAKKQEPAADLVQRLHQRWNLLLKTGLNVPQFCTLPAVIEEAFETVGGDHQVAVGVAVSVAPSPGVMGSLGVRHGRHHPRTGYPGDERPQTLSQNIHNKEAQP